MRWLALAILLLPLCLDAQTMTRQDRLLRSWLSDRPAIKEIVIEGQQTFSEGKIRHRLYSRRHNFWAALKGDRRARVHQETIGRDTLEVKYLYLTHGFLNIGVKESVEPIEPDSTARIRIAIDEGRQWWFGISTLDGDFDPELRGDLLHQLRRLRAGRVMDWFAVRQAAFDLKTVMANNGYPYAKVDYVLDTAGVSDTSDIAFHVVADSLVHYGRIRVEGVRRYKEKTVNRELVMRWGDIYQRKDIIRSQRRLVESGYFSTLSISQADSTDPYSPEFTVRVRERRPNYASIESGIGRTEETDVAWDVAGTFGKRNFLGSRHYELGAEATIGLAGVQRMLEHSYHISYTEPWLFHIRMPLTLTGEWNPGVKDPELDFRLERFSVSISTVRRYGDKYVGRGGIEYETVRIYGVGEDEIDDIKSQEGISVRRNFYGSIRRDARDNVFVPTKGSVTELSFEYYGGLLGGDDNFVKVEAGWSRYQHVWPGWISATRLKTGWVKPFGETATVPIDDRFFLGGANTIRGFRVNSLGPRAAEDSTLLKSDFVALFNQEFRWRTIQVVRVIPVLNRLLSGWPLWQSVFVDVGNGFRDPDAFRFDHLAYSYGTGIQLLSPAGPIRVDYARRIKTDHFAAGQYWHFTILYAF